MNHRSKRFRDRNRPQWSLAKLEPRVMLAADAGAAVASGVAANGGDPLAPTSALVADMSATCRNAVESIVFVDADVSELALIDGLAADDAEIVLLDGQQDGVEQIRRHLDQRSGVRSVHVLSHGAAGKIQLGNATLDANSLQNHADHIRAWRESLTQDADILFYGCDLAADEAGRSLLHQIARFADADVAASDDRTGNASHQADWDLEYQIGSVETPIAMTTQGISQFVGHLAIEIRASGTTGQEIMELEVDGSVVGTWNITSDGAYGGEFDTYTADINGADVNQIRVYFTNDLYEPDQNIDRNLRVDWIRVDGVRYETESPNVYSTGTWNPGIGIQPGYWETEFLHTDGYLQYGDDETPVNSGTIAVADAQLSVDESSGVANVVLQRTGGSDGAAEVSFQTADGSATDPEDYTGAFSSVVFLDGQTSVTLSIDLVDDAIDESDESFTLTLLNVDGAGLGTPVSTTITILDDDTSDPDPDPDPDPEPDGLIGYWRLNESSASDTIVDSSGRGADGQAFNINAPNGPTSDVPPGTDSNPGAFDFDGNDDYIDIAPNESLRLTGGTYTQALWIKPTDTSDSYQGVIGYQSGNVGSRYPFIYTRNDAIYAGFGVPGNAWKGIVADNVLDINQWNHVAVTFDGSTMTLLIDGEVVSTKSNFGGSLPTTETSQLSIGRINNYFAGTVDEVRMYDRALTQSQVQSILGLGDPEPPQSGPGRIGLAATQVTVNEDQGTVSIGLRRTEGTDGIAEVFYQTQDATAISGVDYTGTSSGSVLFADGQDFANIEVPIIDNDLDDGEKSFQLSLFRVEGAAQGEPRTATVTIVDDESGSGLIGYWSLNETDVNGPISDSSGQGNDGQAVGFQSPNGPTENRPDTESPNPGAFSFDGVNDAIEIAEDESLRLTEGSYSQSVWIRPTSNDGNYHGVLGYQSGGVGSRYPFLYVRDQSLYAGFGTGNAWKGITADGVITTGSWNHVAVSFDGTSMVLYVNGEVVGTKDDFGGSLPTTATAQLKIGAVNNQFVGQIDEVRMYDRAINGAEVQNLIDGATLPPPQIVGFFTRDEFATGFQEPTSIEELPDGRFLVSERRGVIQVVNTDGSVNATPLLDINERVNRVGNDRGIMSIAIPPDFAQTRLLYVAYTYDPPEVQGQSGAGGPDGTGGRVARVSTFLLDPTFSVADPDSEVVIVGKNSLYEYIGQPNRRPLLNDPQSGLDANGDYIRDFIASDELSHTIGDMEFASDGSLLISVGDGGSYGRVDPVNLRALDLDSLNGKILRVDRVTGLGLPDNPFFDGDAGSNASRIYSYGLRNPFRFAVNPTDGEVFIGDVGWLNWEEVNTGRGKNFGWPAYEGNSLTGGNRGSYADLPEVQQYLATDPVVTPPIWTRSHSSGATAIIMGDFIDGGDYPEALQGAFLFTDIGDQVIRAGRLDSQGNLIDVIPVSSRLGFITDIMRMDDGSLFYTDLVSGTIGQLIFNV